MTSFRGEEAVVGLIALATIPWIIWILRRGLRDRRLPVGKGQVTLDGRPGAFRLMFALYVVAAFGMAYVGLDLLIGPGALFGRS